MPENLTRDRLDDTLARLSALADEKIRAVNERHGDDHAANLGKLRALAKELKKDQDLALALWATGDTAARLLAMLISRPGNFTPESLDEMIRQARTSKVSDWLLNYVVKKNPAWPTLRTSWLEDPDPDVAAAGWMLTSHAVSTDPDSLDLGSLLDIIEAEMQDAPGRLQWQMNDCLAQIGIHHGELRDRALAIGENLGVLRDYPTSPGCISPFAPIWITEMVKRAEKP